MVESDDSPMSLDLTSAQRKGLALAAGRLPCRAAVGKGGVTGPLAAHVRALLDRWELVKVRLLPAAGKDRAALAGQLARATGAATVKVVGRVVVLYRANEQLPPEQRVGLPGRPRPPSRRAQP